MNTTIKILLMLTLTPLTIHAQDASTVEQTIAQFVQAGDNRDVELMEKTLHETFRTISPGPSAGVELRVIPKATYVELLAGKKIGGDQRSINIISIDIVENHASAKVELTGGAVIFRSYYHLIRNPDNKWRLINDLTIVSPK